jgi:hypothetical protein
MAKSRMYRKKGRKTMRKGKRKTRRIRRRGGADLSQAINQGTYAYATSDAYTGATLNTK